MRTFVLVIFSSLVAQSVHAWVTISQSRYGAQVEDIRALFDNSTAPSTKPAQQLLGYTWRVPEAPTSHDGLGSGITWAWDPNLCSQILPMFQEDFFFVPFVTCSMIKAAMGRGFASWSANSARLSFTDVTTQCEEIGQLNEQCPLAEIWVTAIVAESSSGPSGESLTSGTTGVPIAEANVETGDFAIGDGVSAALALPRPAFSANFVYTNGVRPNAPIVIETRGARISFNTNLCWYLDSTFCSFFHQMKSAAPNLKADDINWIVRGVLLLIWSLAICVMCFQLLSIFCASRKSKSRATNGQCQAWIDSLHRRSMLGISLRLILIIAPPAFYVQIFIPCWECYDFEAAATHEVGHVLGLSHPDNVAESLGTGAGYGSTPGQNVYASNLLNGQRMSAKNGCMNPWQYVVPGTPPDDLTVSFAGPIESRVRPSIMKALTQHNPRVCLSEDDLEALNVLYPDCSHATSVPVCDKVAYNIGWVRLGVWVIAPILLALAFLICVFGITSHQQNKRLDQQIKLRMKRSQDLIIVEREKEEAERKQKLVTTAYRKQLASESQRIEREAKRRSLEMFDELQRSYMTSSEASARLPSTSARSSENSTRLPSVGPIAETTADGSNNRCTHIDSTVWEEAVDSMPRQAIESQYKPGTIGYAADGMANAIEGFVSRLSRITSQPSLSDLGRSVSSIRRTSTSSDPSHFEDGSSPGARNRNRGALERARQALRQKKKPPQEARMPSCRQESSIDEFNSV